MCYSLDSLRSSRMTRPSHALDTTLTPSGPNNGEADDTPTPAIMKPSMHQRHTHLRSSTIRDELAAYIQQADHTIIPHVESFGCTDEDDHAKDLSVVSDELIQKAREIIIGCLYRMCVPI